ncbi:putative inorganic phosphate cotransporter [Oratosquilla oratoria]|uniref:putative inorganic phosphate cotransporter n=1 Tax=Oratosquilla oratoria TaxID=337810 RepID=UPI003F7702FF
MSLSGGTVLMDICDPHDFRRGSSGSRGNDDLIFAVSKSSDLLCVNKVSPPKGFWGARYTLALMGFFAIASAYSMRVSLSVAILAMVKSGNNTKNDSSNICPALDGDDEEASDEIEGEFEWDENVQGLMLGAFSYGYVLTNVLGGRAAEYFGGKKVLGLGIVLTGIFTVVSPVCAWVGPKLFFVSRFAQGLTEGVTFPAMHILLATWIPTLERTKFSALVYAGIDFGTVVTFAVSGWLCHSGFLGGWPSVFYIFGGLAIIWGFFWVFLCFDRPEDHPRISREELLFIKSQTTEGGKSTEVRSCVRACVCVCVCVCVTLPVPWRAIFTSMPFYAILFLHFGGNWGLYILLTETPMYLNYIQHFDLKSNGLLSALPFLCAGIFVLVYRVALDLVYRWAQPSLTTIRKVSSLIAAYGTILGLIAMCFVDCDRTLAVVALCFAAGLSGAAYSGYLSSHMDLSPNFAGTLMGITNTFASTSGFLVPSVTSVITVQQTLNAWRTVFGLSAGIYFVTVTFYIIFFTTETQPWNEGRTKKTKEQKRN